MTISVLRKAYYNSSDPICCIELIIYSNKMDIMFSLYDDNLTQFLLKNINIEYDNINDLNDLIICIFSTLCDKYVSYCKLFIENQIYNMDTLKSIYHIEKPLKYPQINVKFILLKLKINVK